MATYYTPDTLRETPEQRDRLSRWLAQGIALNWYTLAFVLIFVAAVFTRFYGLGDRVMSHDESLHTYYSWELFMGRGFTHTPMMHGPVLFHVTALMYFLFGDNDFTARLYPAILGVLMVLFPLLFRRWLGRIGALLASLMILISPLLLYHHRYIREDTPSIFFTMVMVWATFMYLDGPRHLRRKARWLYIFSAALLLSLASKESGFMYVAVFGLFMTIYWVARLVQHFRRIPMKTFFYYIVMPAMLAGVFALIMYIVLSIGLANYATLEGRVEYIINSFRGLAEGTINADGVISTSLDFNVTIGWTLLALAGLLAVVVGTALWAFRKGAARLRWREIALFLVLTLGFAAALIVFEEVSKVPSRSEALAGDPENDVIDTLAETSLPIVATWVIAGVVVAGTVVAARRGWIRVLYRFPEFDIMLLMGSLILPWMVGLVTSATGASPVDYSPAGIWRAILVIIPLSAIAISMGIAWHWKRWLISAAIFYTLFVFFYTTMFTNPMGLATGMIGSLGYWLEQQGVRRGSQPQYYYQLIIMPMYEYLPVIGTFIAMLAGMTRFWTFRRERLEQRAALSAEADASAPETPAARRALWQ
ncbi:MAG: TIGR03663 family protein, partial [Anaerolinea sp.]|nr:TIGR03663 family protein [Anaerolinea sp.]